MKQEPISTASKPIHAVLVGLMYKLQDQQHTEEHLQELAFLTTTAGAIPVKIFTQKVDRPDSRTFIGSGKLQEIATFVQEYEIDLVIFDDELSPTQQRNIEREIGCRVLDRNNLILDIFAKRARTASAKTQVELAQYQYLLPRLAGMWTHLERQKGGIGLRGPGEKEIETDRRIIRDIISKLKKELGTIDRQMSTQRQNRGELIRVALVGYTNVGKSTVMNVLSKSDVLAENKLFATLDTTVRKIVFGTIPFLLSDTVGFIRKLPTLLIESFKSTLDEVREADILLHIVDISHPNFEAQIQTVQSTLQEIGAGDKKIVLVFNKIDAFAHTPKEHDDLSPMRHENYSLEDWKNTWMGQSMPCLFISASEKTHLDDMRDFLHKEIVELYKKRYPYQSFLTDYSIVEEE